MRQRCTRVVWMATVFTLLAAGRGAAIETTLEGLLDVVEKAAQAEAQIHASRESEFLTARDDRAKLLADALARKSAAEARSKSISEKYDANEIELGELSALLKERQGNLGELFGVTREVAADVANVLDQSLISAQRPDRIDFLRSLAAAKTLPSAPQLEQLWIEMLGEMIESGRVARFNAPVVDPAGVARARDVIRIGDFDAVSEGRFLTYLPANKTLSEIPRQPPSRYTEAAAALGRAHPGGYVEAPLDPSRGVLLSLYSERPTVIERIQRGQAVGYVILVCGFLGAIAALYQIVYLVRARLGVGRQLEHLDAPIDDNPLGRVLIAFQGEDSRIDEEAEVAELRISEVVLREVPKLERFQPLLRLLVAAGPLLGLIGTVIGMIITFQSITEAGTSDPKLMANGIGQAMIATVLGLGIAIPLLFVNAALAALSGQIVQVLEEQSAGFLADNIEKRIAGRHDREKQDA